MAKTFEAIFAIVDKYSEPLLKLEEKLKHLGAVGEQANKMMTPHQKLFSALSEDLAGFGERMASVRESAVELGSQLTELVGPLAAVGAVGSMAGLVEMTHSWSEAMEQLTNAATIAGTTIQTMQALEYAAKQTGVSTDSLQHSLGILNKNLGAAGAGKDKDLVSLLHHLHIPLKNVNGQITSAAQLLPQLADAFENTTDPAMQAYMATELFGKSGRDLLPLLDKGSAGLNDLSASFKKFSYIPSGADQTNALAFQDSWKNMQAAIGGLTDDISAKLAPVLTPIINQMADWTAKNKDWIATGLAKTISDVSDNLKTVHLHDIIADMKTLGKNTWDVVDAIGGMKTVMAVTGLVIAGPFISSVVSLTAAVGSLGVAIGGPVVVSILEMGSTMMEVIPMIDSMSAAMAALDLVMDANPIGLVVIGIGALGVAAWELYSNWQQVSKLMQGPWGEIVVIVSEAISPILGLITAFWRAGDYLYNHWGSISKEMQGTWHTIEGDFHKYFDPFGGKLEALGNQALQYAGGWSGVQKTLSGTWHLIESDFEAVFQPIMGTINKLQADIDALEHPFGSGNAGAGGSGNAGGSPGGNSGGLLQTIWRGWDGAADGGPDPIPSASPSGPQTGASGSQSQLLEIEITHRGAPTGTTLVTRSSGGAPVPRANTGRNSMAGGAQ